MRLVGTGPIEWVEYEPDGRDGHRVNGFAGWVRPVMYEDDYTYVVDGKTMTSRCGGTIICAWDGEKFSRKFYEEHWPT